MAKNPEVELKKLKGIFNLIRQKWLEPKRETHIEVQFYHYEDMRFNGHLIESFMEDMLFGNEFENCVIFAGTFQGERFRFWLYVEEDDDDNLKFIIQFYNHDKEDRPDSGFGPHIEAELNIDSVRPALWKVYDYLDKNDKESADDIEAGLKASLVPWIAVRKNSL